MKEKKGPSTPSFFRIATAHHLTSLIQGLTLSSRGEGQQKGPGCVRLFLLLESGEACPGKQPLALGQRQAGLRAPSQSLPSSIYRSYFGNFLSELKAHSWDSVAAFPAGKQGISWRLLEPPGPKSHLLGDPGAAGRRLGWGHL